MSMPATMPSTARPVATVEESLKLSNGRSPVRINHRPSKSNPCFLPQINLTTDVGHPEAGDVPQLETTGRPQYFNCLRGIAAVHLDRGTNHRNQRRNRRRIFGKALL